MNAKKCKVLRNTAKKLTVGKPAVAYERLKPLKMGDFVTWLGQVVLAPGCTRFVYHQLKAAK